MKNEEIHMKGLSLETAFVYDFTSHGENLAIDVINPLHSKSAVSLFTK